MPRTFYTTTPIYYVNDKPHIGHAYTTILADVLTRYHRARGDDSFFLTGTDEHGQKVQRAAEKNKITPKEHCDATVVRFQEVWRKLGITNDDFIRTTEERHTKVVQSILQDLFDRGLIYKAEYKGRYCVPCERFYTDKDFASPEALCPECGRGTEELVEANYFFKMGQYQEWLIEYIKTNPQFIQPSFRANETLGFLRKPLEDLCVSRPKSRLSWGIELPFDKNYVCYVWFDALLNYITAIGHRTDEEKFKRWWPATCQLIGKDILTTHTVYWPTMLKAIGVELPRTIFAHGWWMMGDDKMSKSLGNVVNPMEMIDKFGVDAFRYFLISEMAMGQDASFSEAVFESRYNSDLANDLGNLLNRVVKMTAQNCGGVIPRPAEDTELETEFKQAVVAAVSAMEEAVDSLRLNKGVEAVMAAVRAGNRYLEKAAPWKLAKQGDSVRLGTVLNTAAEALRIIAGLLAPIMPAKTEAIRKAIAAPEPAPGVTLMEDVKIWGRIPPDAKIDDPGVLFPKIEPTEKPAAVDAKAKSPEKGGKAEAKPAANVVEGVISIDDFRKVSLKTAKVLKAEKVEGADKLLRLEVEVGAEQRQIVAGIAKFYTPEQVVGRAIVVVANLKPAKIRGLESNGMLLAANTGDSLRLVGVEGDCPSGASVG